MLRFLTHLVSRFGLILASIPIPPGIRTPLWTRIGSTLGANPEEAEYALNTFPNFQSFFTRTLKSGTHTIDTTENVCVSPVDASWLSHCFVEEDTFFPVKKNRHTLTGLLDRPGYGLPKATVSTFYLRPKDYHRIHAPFDMEIKNVRHVPGLLVPVNRWGQKMTGLFSRNERWILGGTVNNLEAHIVFVGAMMVGSIRLSHPGLNNLLENSTVPVSVSRGHELGMFLFGSTVIIVFKDQVGQPYAEPREVRVGERLFAL